VNDTITVTVAPVNDAPIVDNEVVTTNEDTPVAGDLTDAGDTDPDGTALTANTTPVSGPTNGTIVINTDGTFTYTPNAGFSGTDVVVVSICDAGTPGVTCVNDTINITVAPVNDAPIVDNEVITTNEDAPATGDLTDAGDSDPDGTPLTANTTPVSGPSNGTIVINTDGTYTYTPNPNFNGTDVIVVSICDAGTPGVVCVNDTITVTVAPVNDAPIVDNEVVTTNEDTPATGDLTDAGDSDPDGTALTANTTPVSGPSNGTIVINSDGTYTYTPNTNFNGVDTVVVSICDAGLPLPGICVNDTIFITVNAVNDAPIVDNEFVTTTEETPATGDLTDAGDSDPDGTPLTANTTPVSGPSNGTIVINTDGTYTYTPNTNFNGVDTVVVSVCDAGTPGVICVNDTIFITVIAVNDAPIVDNEIITTNEDTPVTGDLTDAGDTDPDGTSLTVDITPVSGPSNGTIVMNTDGTYTYTPNPNFSGVDTVVVSVCDAGLPLPGICVNDTIFITVNAVNDAPIVDNEFVTTTEETPATGDLTDAGDSDPDGTALTANTTPVSGPSNGTIVINTDGTYTYTPNPNFNGTDVIVVSICDAGTPLPGVCVNDTITVTVAPVNDAPIVDNEVVTTNEDTPATGDLTDAGDSDPDGTALTANTTPVSGPTNGTIVINTDGTFTYTPNAGFSGTDVVVVSICDAGTPGVICINDTINITVSPVNDAPIVDNEVVNTNEDTPASGDLTDAGDSDPDGTALTANTTPVSGPSNGTIVINADGTYTYTPNTNFNGVDTVVVSVCDAGTPGVICVNDTIFITVTAVNDAPIVDNEIITTNEDTPVTGDLTDAGDTDPDGTSLTVDITPVSGPSNGTIVINADGTFTYTPNPGFTGTDTIVVSICDEGLPLPGICVNDTIFITVVPCSSNPAFDCDGDGVTNGQEVADGTNPTDPCSLLIASQTEIPSTVWNDADCDNDGLTNGEEMVGTTDPLNPDTDGDGVLDGTEVADGTNPTDPCSLLIASQTVAPSTAWSDADCDNDGITNGEEIAGGTDPLNPDTDGDGVLDGTEVADGTNPTDPCSLLIASQTVAPSTAWSDADCDNDGITNGEEMVGTTDPLNPDTDGDGVLDGTEVADGTNPTDPCSLLIASQTVTPSSAWNESDCDNDGVTNGLEVANSSDPFNPCSPKPCDILIPEAFTPDGDGINDEFVIEGIELYPNNTIAIFNRWGVLVYEASNYENNWDGSTQSNFTLGGDDLPTATYYYVFDTKDENVGVFTGYIYLQR
jgi:gliding motility-associated-like protein